MLALISLNMIAEQIQIGILEAELEELEAQIEIISGRDALKALVFDYKCLEDHERIQFAKIAYQDSDTCTWLYNHFGFDCLAENLNDDEDEQWLSLAEFLGADAYIELEEALEEALN